MIRKLPQVLVLSSLALFLAAAQPASALSGISPAETGRGLWAFADELIGRIFQSIGLAGNEPDRPHQLFANHGSILDPDGAPAPPQSGAANPSVPEPN